MLGGGSALPDAVNCMTLNEQYWALYNRTYRVLCDAGIDERLADELATQRTLAVALTSQTTARTDREVATLDISQRSYQ